MGGTAPVVVHAPAVEFPSDVTTPLVSESGGSLDGLDGREFAHDPIKSRMNKPKTDADPAAKTCPPCFSFILLVPVPVHTSSINVTARVWALPQETSPILCPASNKASTRRGDQCVARPSLPKPNRPPSPQPQTNSSPSVVVAAVCAAPHDTVLSKGRFFGLSGRWTGSEA